MDSAIQILVQTSLRKRIPYHSHLLVLAGHPAQRRMNDSMRREFYWRHMANHVYNTRGLPCVACDVSNCSACARNSSRQRLKRRMQLFPAIGTLAFIAIDIQRPLPRTTKYNQHFIVKTDRYTKLNRAVPANVTSST